MLSVRGKMVLLEAYKTDGYYPFVCATDVLLQISNELVETSTYDSGSAATFASKKKYRWLVTFSGVTILSDIGTNYYSWEVATATIRDEGLDIQVRFIDEGGNEKVYRGHALPTDLTMGGSASDLSRSQFTLQGDGELDTTQTLSPITPKSMRYEWTTTGTEGKKVQNNALKGIVKEQLTAVVREGNPIFKVIDAGVPNARQVKLDAIAGTLEFSIDILADEYIWCVVSTV